MNLKTNLETDKDKYIVDLNNASKLAQKRVQGTINRERKRVYDLIGARKEKDFIHEYNRFFVEYIQEVLKYLDSETTQDSIDLIRDLIFNLQVFKKIEKGLLTGDETVDWARVIKQAEYADDEDKDKGIKNILMDVQNSKHFTMNFYVICIVLVILFAWFISNFLF